MNLKNIFSQKLIEISKVKLTFLFLILISSIGNSQTAGTWTPISAPAPHPNGGGMIMLSDGSILAKSFGGGSDGMGNIYDRLTPDINGSYVNGTWSSIAPMFNTRLYFASQVLMDGRVYVAGGEYGTGYGVGEVYNPVTNSWTLTPSLGAISDANSEILPDGKVLQALVTGSYIGNSVYDPTINVYVTGPNCVGVHNESAWMKLPDNSILMVDMPTMNSERYIPALNQWIPDATVPVALYDPYGSETGGALLLPDGRAVFFGSLGTSAYYTPSGTTSPGTWAAGPNMPAGAGQPDAPSAMMVDGKILMTGSPVPTSSNVFNSPTFFFIFDYVANTITQINGPNNVTSIFEPCYTTGMIDLPDGNILFAQQDSLQYYVYTPTGAPLTSGKPTIGSISNTNCDTFKITGTLFNGISQGASYGDDWQMSTNYPIIRLKSNTSGNVYYAKSFNWNSTGVMRGSAPDSTYFVLPVGLPAGTYGLEVVANGIPSDTVTFIPCFTTDVATNSDDKNISVYPNPSNDFITVKRMSNSSNENYTITDQLGRVVLSGELNSESSDINIKEIATGIYFLKVGNQNTIKLVKN